MSDPMKEEDPIESHAEWARRDTERRRLKAYADPETGSDRHFAEANRLAAEGQTEESTIARAAGLARYGEIKAMHPWPEVAE